MGGTGADIGPWPMIIGKYGSSTESDSESRLCETGSGVPSAYNDILCKGLRAATNL